MNRKQMININVPLTPAAIPDKDREQNLNYIEVFLESLFHLFPRKELKSWNKIHSIN